MARKYINLFDEQGNPVRVPLGADAVNVDLATITGLNSTNVQAALAELLGKISQGQGQGTEGGAGFIDNATIGNLNDIDVIDVKLTGPQFTWKEDKKVVENNGTLSEVTAAGYTTNSVGYVKLFAGDVLVTNADSDDVLLFTSSAKLMDGRDEFDGEYVAYKAETDLSVKLSYKADVDYDVHVFVLRRGIVNIPITVYAGKLIGGGQAQIGSTTSISASGYSYVITDYITVNNAAGKYLFVPEGFVEEGFVYTRYKAMPQGTESASDVAFALNAGTRHKADFPYLFVPITSDEEIYRFAFKYGYASTARIYLVTLDWMKRHGYADQWAGKKWIMYGDSSVAGQGVADTWHKLFAEMHFADYTNLGTGGIGLMVNASENIVGSLLSHLEDTLLDSGEPLDVDVIGITCGRNDYSAGVPIGDIDDMVEEPIPYNPRVNPTTNYNGDATFMGGLNYLCKWLLDHYPTKHIFFISPWYFLDDKDSAITTPVEYVDAVLKVTGKWGIPCFDAARQSGISVQSETFRSTYFLSSSDTSHLNYAGHRRMARGPVSKWLENLFSE